MVLIKYKKTKASFTISSEFLNENKNINRMNYLAFKKLRYLYHSL